MILYRLTLRAIALRVPRTRRAEWLAEWSAELWYITHATPPVPHAQIARFCRGALDDARFLRTHPAAPEAKHPTDHSATTCIATLAFLALLFVALAQAIPNVRRTLHPLAHTQPTDLVVITPAGGKSSVSLGVVRALEHRTQHVFSRFAFYEPITRPVHIAPGISPGLHIARASANLLNLLGVPISLQPAASVPPGSPRLILSESAWRTHFHADPDLLTRSLPVRVGLQPARLGGVVLDADLSIPAGIDAWLLLPDTLAQSLPDSTPVTFLARIAPQNQSQTDPAAPTSQPTWHLTVPGAAGTRSPDIPADYLCTNLATSRNRPWHLFAFAALLALLALPAATALSLAEYTAPHPNLPLPAQVRRWLFLFSKIALALPAICFAALDLAYALPAASPNTPAYLQLIATFSLTLFAFRWALRDQHRRCPVCLARLTCPARVGEPSRNFLSFNGTELICAGGHGLLHVPELPTSWFAAPRWLHLDPSWRDLFPGPA